MKNEMIFLMLAAVLAGGFGGCSPESINKDPIENNSWIVEEKEDAPVITEPEQELFFNKPQEAPQSVAIKIFKEKRILELYDDTKLLGRFKIALGGAPEGDKEREGDSKTPVGNYYVCTRNDKSRFTLFLGLSYPNIDDAQRGLDSGMINKDSYDSIKQALQQKRQPPWNTPLGGEVGIHGGGADSDWTAGCIALSDDDIRILWQYCPMKTPVEIFD